MVGDPCSPWMPVEVVGKFRWNSEGEAVGCVRVGVLWKLMEGPGKACLNGDCEAEEVISVCMSPGLLMGGAGGAGELMDGTGAGEDGHGMGECSMLRMTVCGFFFFLDAMSAATTETRNKPLKE